MKPITASLAAAALALTAACATETPTISPAPAAEAPTAYTAPTTGQQQLPDPAQFSIKLKILRQQCFRGAGCNITYQIDPDWNGPEELHPDSPIRVIYQVNGGDAGPIINNFTVDAAGIAHYQLQEFVSTASQPANITARVLNVTTES